MEAVLVEMPAEEAEAPGENLRSTFFAGVHAPGGAGTVGSHTVDSAGLQEPRDPSPTGVSLEREGEGGVAEDGDAEKEAADVAGCDPGGSSCMQEKTFEQLAGELLATKTMRLFAGEVMAGQEVELADAHEQEKAGGASSGCVMPCENDTVENENKQEITVEKEEDVLHLEGIIDDEAGLLPAGEQDDDDCSDDNPPALDHLGLTTSGAVFEGDETSSSVSDQEQAQTSSMESEDEDEILDEKDGDLIGAESQDVTEEVPAEECSSEMLTRVWIEKFERLKAFKEEHGHPHVRLDEPLGPWALVQRQKFKQGRLSTERERMLREIGFCFDGKQALELRGAGGGRAGAAQSARQRQLACGAGSSPRQRSSNLRMSEADAGSLPPRVKRGVKRCVSPPRPREKRCGPGQSVAADCGVDEDARWRRRYEELVRFRNKHGRTFEGMKCTEKMAYSRELYWWSERQRQAFRNGAMPAARRKMLDAISFEWGTDAASGLTLPVASGVVGEGGGRLRKKKKTAAAGSEEPRLTGPKGLTKIRAPSTLGLPVRARSASSRHSDLWKEADCDRVNEVGSKLMEGLVLQALTGVLSKKRGREGWSSDLRNALRSERKGIWRTDKRRVCQLLRSLEANLPWRTMDVAFHQQRGPLLDSIKEIETASDVVVFLRTLIAFTKVDCWREAYRAVRLGVEPNIVPGAGRAAPCGMAEAPTHCTKREVLEQMADLEAGDTGGSSVGSCPPSPPDRAEEAVSSPPKRRKLAAKQVKLEGMGEWLAGVGVAPSVVPLMLACLANEEWAVRNQRMLCALDDDELEEMMMPLRDPASARMLVSSVRVLRPSFFAHAADMLSRGSPSGAGAPEPEAPEKGRPCRSAKTDGAGRRRRSVPAERALWNKGKTASSTHGARRVARKDSRRVSKQKPVPAVCEKTAGVQKKLEEIRGKKMTADGHVLYLAHWQGCDTDDDTWEHAAGLGSDEWLVSEWEAEQTALRKPNISLKA